MGKRFISAGLSKNSLPPPSLRKGRARVEWGFILNFLNQNPTLSRFAGVGGGEGYILPSPSPTSFACGGGLSLTMIENTVNEPFFSRGRKLNINLASFEYPYGVFVKIESS